MDEKRRKRARERTEQFVRTDPTMQKLRERIEYYRAKAEKSRRERS
jgi:hypothetical protein